MSGGCARVTVMTPVEIFPARSVACAVIVLAPITNRMPETDHVPAAASSVAAVPLTVTWATPEALAPPSEAAPLMLMASSNVVELFAGELMLTTGGVVSAVAQAPVIVTIKNEPGLLASETSKVFVATSVTFLSIVLTF